MTKRAAHDRLKHIRRILDVTQQEFATRVGVSCAYILAVETGQRALSLELAERCACATGVTPEWLRGAGPDEPVDYRGRPLTRESAERYARRGRRLPVDPIEDEDSHAIDDLCESLTKLLRASLRRGRFAVCRYFARKMIEEAESNLGLRTTVQAEEPDALPGRKAAFPGGLDYSDTMVALRLLSPNAQFRWSDALKGSAEERATFLEEVDTAHAVIEASFTSRKASRPG